MARAGAPFLIPSRSRYLAAAFAILTVIAMAAPVIAQTRAYAHVAQLPGVADEEAKPFIWPTVGKISQPYGCTGFVFEPRRGNCRHFHEGIDIANMKGTPIRAAAAGRVTHVGWDQWGTRNWMVMLDHGDGVVTWYAHMRGRDIDGLTVGTFVGQGDLVGYMDTTGLSTGPHLHWAVRIDGRFVNPINFVDGGPAARQKSELGVEPPSCETELLGLLGPNALHSGATTAAATEGADSGDPQLACLA